MSAAIHKRLDNDLRFFAKNVLKIKTKDGTTKPLAFNTSQEFLHEALEKQLATLGRVRALILKGRQQGCSTYVAGRYYHKATRKHDKNVFILCHEAETTKKLFKMALKYHEDSPEPLRPIAKISNRRELEFKDINAEYAVGTAGNEDVGRGGTVQLFHGSEVAFWEKTDGIETGVLQSIADISGTEIILESTANGMTNMFYRKCMAALEGKSDYILIFIPWFWQNEYQRDVPPDRVMELSEEEQEYKALYELTNEQMYWRRAKIVEFDTSKATKGKGGWKFKQEYPGNVMEAFQTSGETLIPAQSIMRARKSIITDTHAPLIIGVDPGRKKDRTVLSYRRGRVFLEPDIMEFDSKDTQIQMKIAGMVARKIEELNPDMVFIDTGEGWGVVDRLHELGYGRLVKGIEFGSGAIENTIYLNKRAEMWCALRDWLNRESGEVSIPDSNLIQKDLMSMPDEITTSTGKIKMMDKKTIIKEYGMSPDIADSMAVTFAFPVRKRNLDGQFTNRQIKRKQGKQKSSLTTLNRRRGYNTMKWKRIA